MHLQGSLCGGSCEPAGCPCHADCSCFSCVPDVVDAGDGGGGGGSGACAFSGLGSGLLLLEDAGQVDAPVTLDEDVIVLGATSSTSSALKIDVERPDAGRLALVLEKPGVAQLAVTPAEVLRLQAQVYRNTVSFGGPVLNQVFGLSRDGGLIAFGVRGEGRPTALPNDLSFLGFAVSGGAQICEGPQNIGCYPSYRPVTFAADAGQVTLRPGETGRAGPLSISVGTYFDSIDRGFCDFWSVFTAAGAAVP